MLAHDGTHSAGISHTPWLTVRLARLAAPLGSDTSNCSDAGDNRFQMMPAETVEACRV